MIADERIPLRVVVPQRAGNPPSPDSRIYTFTTNVVEDVPAWNVATAYSPGARVSVTTPSLSIAQRGIYEALANTTGESPQSFPAKWIRVSAAEVDQPFDKVVATGARAVAGNITYSLQSQTTQSDTVILYVDNVVSARVRVIEHLTSNVIYDQTINLADTSLIVDAWTYFFGRVDLFSSCIFEGVPAFARNTIEVTLERQSPDSTTPFPEAREIVIGQSLNIGNLTSGGRVGIEDFSRKERDTFGNFNVIQRAYSDFADFGLILRGNEVDTVRRRLAALRATPCVYHAGQENVGRGLIAFGFFKDLAIEFTSGPIATCTLSIEGLT